MQIYDKSVNYFNRLYFLYCSFIFLSLIIIINVYFMLVTVGALVY